MTLLGIDANKEIAKVTISADKPIAGKFSSETSEWAESGNAIDLASESWFSDEEDAFTLTTNANGEATIVFSTIPVREAIFTVTVETAESETYKKVFARPISLPQGDLSIYSVGLKKQAHVVLTENFNAINASTNQYSCASNLTTEGNDEGLDYKWTVGGSVYVFQNGIRLCSGSSTGSVTNSTILEAIPTGTEFMVKVYAADWRTDGSKLNISYAGDQSVTKDCNNTAISSTSSLYSPNDFAKSTDFTFTKGDGANGNILTIASNGSGKRVLIDKIEVIYDGDAPSVINASDIDGIDAAGVSEAQFNFSSVNVSGTPSVTCDGTVVTSASVEGKTVTYTVSENTTYKTREGSITISIGEYEKTITVSQNGLEPQYSHAGTATDPYDISDALLKIATLDEGESSEDVWVGGPIKTVDSFNDTYGSLTYVIGSGDETLKIFGGLDFGGAKFSSTDDLTVGQNVVVCGKLKEYESVSEMDSNNKLVSVNGKDYLLKSISVSGAQTQFDEGDEFSKGEAVVTASYRGNKENTDVTASAVFDGYASTVGLHEITVSYTENGITKTTSYDVTVADNTEYNITVNKTGTGSGTVEVKVNDIVGSQARHGASIEVTVTPNTKNHVETFSITGLEGDEALTDGKFYFTMPAGAVTINVQFEPNPTAANGEKLWSYDFSTTYAYQNATVSYSYGGGSSSQNENLAGGTSPEYLIKSGGGTMTITGVPTGNATAMTLTFLSNHADYLEVSVTGITGATAENTAEAFGKAKSEWMIVVPDETEKFNIVITNTNTGTNARIDNLELIVGAPKRAQTISFSESSKSITLGDEYAINGTYTIQTANHTVGDGTISYSVTEGADVVSVNSSNGNITILKAGTAKITATAAGTDDYKSASTSYTLTINEAGGGKTEQTIYSTGFETSEGYTTSTNYQGTVSQKEWTIYYGTFSTSSAITGSSSLHMRLYSNKNAGYAITPKFTDATSITFNYQVSNKAVNFKVQVSTDDGSTWTDKESISPSNTSKTECTIDFGGTLSNVKVKILVTSGWPSSSNYTFRIDDVIVKGMR